MYDCTRFNLNMPGKFWGSEHSQVFLKERTCTRRVMNLDASKLTLHIIRGGSQLADFSYFQEAPQ